MLIRLGRRAIGMVTSFFALLGFIAVPIGERTGYEHVKSALATPEGQEAVAAMSRAYEATREKFFSWAIEKLGAATSSAEATKALSRDPEALLERGDRDTVNGQGTLPGSGSHVVSHDEDSLTVARGGGRKNTGISQREER